MVGAYAFAKYNQIPMREIKFRAWDTAEKRMIYGGGPININGDKTWLSIDFGGGITARFTDWANEDRSDFELTAYIDSDRFVLQQFTCLLDKNLKEIYEGDIVRGGDEYTQFEPTAVIFEDGAFFPFAAPNWELSMSFEQCEVIGNVCENADLLK